MMVLLRIYSIQKRWRAQKNNKYIVVCVDARGARVQSIIERDGAVDELPEHCFSHIEKEKMNARSDKHTG